VVGSQEVQKAWKCLVINDTLQAEGEHKCYINTGNIKVSTTLKGQYVHYLNINMAVV
jgi:hypothetical protein